MTPLRFLTAALLAITLSGPTLAETPYSSVVDGLKLVALDTLPAAPTGGDGAAGCETLASLTTPAGRVAASLGWNVTSEIPFGDLTAVSFYASDEPFPTSGLCRLLDGNVGFFSGDQLVALLYATEGKGQMIGFVVPFSGGGLRVLSGDHFPTPTADLQRTGSDGIAAVPVAKEEPVCGGAASVPNIYNMPIAEARVLLRKAGWMPVPSESVLATGEIEDLQTTDQVIELQYCSGTGVGICTFGYTGPAGELSVRTAGEVGPDGGGPLIMFYSAECR